MLIQNLEKKMKSMLVMCVCAVTASTLLALFAIAKAFSYAQEESSNIYVMSNNIPMLAQREKMEMNFLVECKAHVEMFHQYFFTLPPDDDYIKWTTQKALYLIDQSGMQQRNALAEKGFYTNLQTASAVFNIVTDSIKVDTEKMEFTYWGKQYIDRPTSTLVRALTTQGNLKSVPRTENNPHGLLITNWRTIENKDLNYSIKSSY